MVIGNVMCVFNIYSYGGHKNQLGYYDISFADTDNTCYSTLDKLWPVNLLILFGTIWYYLIYFWNW